VGPGRVKLPSSFVAFLKPKFSSQYLYEEGAEGTGVKDVCGTLDGWSEKKNSYDDNKITLVWKVMC